MRMKYWIIFSAILLGIFITVPLANAGTVVPGDWITFNTIAGSGAGGAFQVNYSSGPSAFAPFLTFCIEENEALGFDSIQYYVYDVSNVADYGGNSPSPHPDPISVQTDYLFYMFATGQITGWSGSADQQFALSQVFWFLEQEIGALDASNTLETDYYNLAFSADITKTYGTQVINISLSSTDPTSARAQSVLYNSIPEPASLLLLGMGLCSIGIIARKKSR